MIDLARKLRRSEVVANWSAAPKIGYEDSGRDTPGPEGGVVFVNWAGWIDNFLDPVSCAGRIVACDPE